MDSLLVGSFLREVSAYGDAMGHWISQHPYHVYGGLGGIGALMLAAGLGLGRRRPMPDGWGSAHFADKRTIKTAGLFRPDGIVVGHAYGRTLRLPRDRHALIVGPSGSGKSVLIRKTLQTYQHSVIYLALKSTDVALTAPTRERLGPVYCFDPVHGGDALNPWDLIAWRRAGEVKDIQRLVDHVTYIDADTRSDASLYYRDHAQRALWAMLPYLYYSRVAPACMGGLRKFLAVSGTAIRPRVQAMFDFGQPSPHSLIHEWAAEVIGTTTDHLNHIFTAARRWLSAWADPVLDWNTRETTIDLQAFQQQPHPATLYLRIGVEDIQGRLRPFVRLLLDLLSLRLIDRDEKAFIHDVLWVLDDMPELRHLEMIDRLHAYMRGFGHVLLAGSQSFGQLWEHFGRHTALRNNARAWVLFPPMDDEEGEAISKKLGEMTVLEDVERVSRSRYGRSRSHGLQSHRRRLQTADEIQRWREDQLCVCVYGHPPMLVERGPETVAA